MGALMESPAGCGRQSEIGPGEGGGTAGASCCRPQTSACSGSYGAKRPGAVAYDLTHTYLPPAVLAVAGVLSASGLAVALALVWFAHIGMDRRCAWGCSTRTVLAAPTSGRLARPRTTPIREVAHGPVDRARPDELLVGGAEVVAEIGALIILDGRRLLDPMAASRSRRCATASGNGSSWSLNSGSCCTGQVRDGLAAAGRPALR
jgi:Domain of unknown function (DUF4260)